MHARHVLYTSEEEDGVSQRLMTHDDSLENLSPAVLLRPQLNSCTDASSGGNEPGA